MAKKLKCPCGNVCVLVDGKPVWYSRQAAENQGVVKKKKKKDENPPAPAAPTDPWGGFFS